MYLCVMKVKNKIHICRFVCRKVYVKVWEGELLCRYGSIKCCVGRVQHAAVIYSAKHRKDRNDHTTMTAPLPVCSAKLSIVGPG